MMQCHTTAGSININIKVNILFILPEITRIKIVTWNFHVDVSAKVRYYMILGRYPLTDLLLDIKLSDHIIEAYEKHFKGSKAPIVEMVAYEFKGLNSGKITYEEMFMDAYHP